MVNDSIANPPPRFTTRNVVRPNGTVVNYTKSGIQFSPDSLLSYSEGDSIVITFNATDQDSAQGGGLNQALTFGVPNWARFIKRPSSHTDSLALDTNSVLVSGSPRALKVRIQVGYNVADTLGNNLPDTVRLVVSVTDESANAVNDTMLFKIANVNRPPIWDADTSSKPSDSALVYSFSPAAVEPDSVEAFTPIPVTNGVTDSLYFSQYIYDPDPLVRDSLGPGLTYSTTSNLGSFFSTTSGLLEVLLTSLDTLSQTFPISATDTDPNSPKTATVTLTLRVAPEPEVAETYPLTGYPGQDITIFGSGFGLFDDSDSTALSKVVFRSRDSNGQAQNLRATVNSWSRDRINVTIPRNAAVSLFSVPLQQIIPDTIEISSSVFTSPTLYPFVITLPDSTTIYQMESSNITSTSAVVKWRTAFTGSDSVIVATVQDTLDVTGTNVNFDIFKDSNGNYWPYFVIPNADTLTYTRSTVQVFRGSTSTTDQVHVITLEGLVPATKYQFIIALKDELFFGDTLRNLNGPYAPAKISRDNVGNGAIRGFLLETLPEQNNNGQTFAVAGKVVNSSGSAAIGAVVTLQVVDKDNVADTTLPLTSTVGSDSSWVVNLGNAVIDTTSDVSDRLYQHKQGDYLVISIAADKDVGFTKFTTTRAATTPQIVNLNGATTLLVAAVDYDIRLKVGLNLIGIPVNLFLTEPQTAKAVLTEITGGTPSITRYVTSTATQETIIKTIAGGSNQFIGASDWNLVDSDGNYYDAYFLSLDQLNFLNLSGSVYGTALPVKLFPAPGLYWIARPAQSSSLFYAWSSRTMLSNIANATEIFRYNRDTQQYDTAVIDGSTSAFIGTDFAIDVSEGYIIDITAASQWDMNTPTATQMANASVMFDNISGVTPSLTLDLSQASAAAGTGALRNIRLTDITSSAAKISWVGNTSMNVQVRYGKAAEGLTSVAQFKASDLKGGVGVLQLLGLKPETEYVYEIVSNGITYNNNGNPFTFKSAKIGIGDPYTVYGRLVDETGQPLADAVIYLSAKSNDEVSSTIAVLTDERGYWTANLANLKLVSSGAVYAWKAGDEIKVTAVYGDASTSFRTLVSGNSPQNVIRVSDTDGVASTDKKEAARVALPKAFALGQNYPNPFNPSTTIAFDIPEDRTSGVQVELKVFNVRGQVIRNLVNDTKQPGRYVIQWNGENDNNEKVASGVYFYRVKAGDYVATRKMVLLK
ncbi:MAG: hypothetical protein A3F83_04650 [Candidatus Glassbacteria bacterium RIFCSPLOWO2_12_FULL_58_11]|uniref:Fibronectin type-III domain-containing protein n=1 Tax=Candidatus Glassbacteria bacterium RIFCSPLOWO2_12_FULL_58_11 TaxID=1817867 RepID=A0A1F5YW92_9BACT|nr:MAG: hypothetical protein A3F83_04650 [Candidatus Glassbacteria bacterium RIFCSPLOWO2_12_FULL_58_11]